MSSIVSQYIKNHHIAIIILVSVAFSATMFYLGQESKEREFYEQRSFFREHWDCDTIEAMIYPTGTWDSYNGNSQREYLNSLWIVNECWKE